MPESDNQQGGSDTPSQTSVVNADGSFVENWADQYPEAARPTLSRFKKFDELVTSHMALRKMSNKDPDRLVVLPDESSTDEEKAEFHRQRGVPDTTEGYKYVRSPDLSEDVETSDEKVAAFAQIAKKHNLTDGQFNGVVNEYLALIGKDIAAFDLIEQDREDKELRAAEAALKKELGNAYDEKVARANLLMKKYGGQEMVAELGLENNPAMIRFLDKIAEDMSEDRIKGLTKVTTPTPDAVSKKIAELREHPAYLDANHPQHQSVLDEINNLYKKKSA